MGPIQGVRGTTALGRWTAARGVKASSALVFYRDLLGFRITVVAASGILVFDESGRWIHLAI